MLPVEQGEGAAPAPPAAAAAGVDGVFMMMHRHTCCRVLFLYRGTKALEGEVTMAGARAAVADAES